MIGFTKIFDPQRTSRKRAYNATVLEPPLLSDSILQLGQTSTYSVKRKRLARCVFGTDFKRLRTGKELNITNVIMVNQSSNLKMHNQLNEPPRTRGYKIRQRPVTKAVVDVMGKPTTAEINNVKHDKGKYASLIGRNVMKAGRILGYMKDKILPTQKIKDTQQKIDEAKSLVPEIPATIVIDDDIEISPSIKKVQFEREDTEDTLKTETDLDEQHISSQSLEPESEHAESPAQFDHQIPSQQNNQLDKSHISLSSGEPDETYQKYTTTYTSDSEYSDAYSVDRYSSSAPSPSAVKSAPSSRIEEAEAGVREARENSRNVDLVVEEFKKLRPSKEKHKKWRKFQPALTDYDLEEAEGVVRSRQSALIVQKYKLDIYGQAMRTLDHMQWLDDNIINFYMEMINERSKIPSGNYPKVWAVNTFFFSTLNDKGYNGVRRWSKRQKVDVFKLDYLIIPVHLGVHWTIAIVDIQLRELTFYDSMGAAGDHYVELIKEEYLVKQHQNYENTPLPDPEEWKCISKCRKSPQQNNGSDCGVFSCCIAENVGRCGGHGGWDFSQKDMPEIRKKMALEIKRGQLF